MAYHSIGIEGNTLSYTQCKSIILNNYILRAVKEREFYEVRNYKNLLPKFIENLKHYKKLDNELIKEFYYFIIQDLIDNNGQFKKIENVIIGTNFEPTKPYLVPIQLKDLIDNLYYKFDLAKNDDDKTKAILESHINFERIHPFSDGNGRIGRLLMVYSCLEQNLSPIIVPQEEKERYIAYLREENIKDFLNFAKKLQVLEKERFEKFIKLLKPKKVRKK